MIDLTDTQNLLETRNRLSCFGATLPSCSGAYIAEKVLLDKFGGRSSTTFRQADIPAETTLVSMPRWLPIVFPKRAAEQTGRFGTSVLIADLLSWTREGRDYEKASYSHSLAEALREAPTPRPSIEDPSGSHRLRLADLLKVMEDCEANPQVYDPNEKLAIYAHSRDALDIVEFGERFVYAGFDYPLDYLPPADDDGLIAKGFMTDVGWVLRKLMDHADYVDGLERQHIRIALDYFPDPDIDIEVELSGETFVATEPQVLEAFHKPLPHHLMLPAEGSIRLDHYGEASAFSHAVDAYEFTMHRPAAHLDIENEYEGLVFLRSDRLIYTMSCDRQ